MATSRAVLITGCSSGTGHSSGTGRATALRLHRAGWPVYATARNTEALRELTAEGIEIMHLDVTDEASMAAVVKRISEEHGSVGTLINNAAYSLNGTFSETPIDDVRKQFETNVFGPARLTQMVLPGMREHGAGRIIMMSSIFGLFATPGRGYYQATKYALEAMSDSLRNEVRKFGVKVVVIQPSPIRGGFVPTTTSDLDMNGDQQDGVYGDFWENFVDWHGAYREVARPKGRGRTAVSVERVAEVIEKAATVPNPRIRYKIGIPVRILPLQRAIFGEQAWDKFVRAFFPIP
jgi:NAD(P)-dependent dehydrogenase (short-subunit alcohol dehydrogenase family)